MELSFNDGNNYQNDSAFLSLRKLVCNLLLGVHPICINKWMHPICTKYIHKYYINLKTIHNEYENTNKAVYIPIRICNDVCTISSCHNNVIVITWCLKNDVFPGVTNNSILESKNIDSLQSFDIKSTFVATINISARNEFYKEFRFITVQGPTESISQLLDSSVKCDVSFTDDSINKALSIVKAHKHSEIIRIMLEINAKN